LTVLIRKIFTEKYSGQPDVSADALKLTVELGVKRQLKEHGEDASDANLTDKRNFTGI